MAKQKQFTAEEMRGMALVEESYGWDIAAEMLRQAADELERETKYEYAILWDYDDSLFEASIFYEYIKQRMDELNADGRACHLVRREVGKWEPVPGGDGE